MILKNIFHNHHHCDCGSNGPSNVLMLLYSKERSHEEREGLSCSSLVYNLLVPGGQIMVH